MTPDAEKIYKAIVTMPIKDYFFSLPSCLAEFDDPSQLLLDGEKERFIRICQADTDMPYEKMSAYERFAAFVSYLPRMNGSSVYELFCEELELYFGYKLDPLNCDARVIWQTLCQELFERKYGNEKNHRQSYSESDTKKSLPILQKGLNYDELVSVNLKALSECDREGIVVNISDLDFQRTDRYHAERAYAAYCKGETEDTNELLSGLLYSVFEYAEKNGICLSLEIEDNLSSFKNILKYFGDRGILPNIRVFAVSDILFSIASELCGRRQNGAGNKKILCGLVWREGDTSLSIAETIKNIARVYPIGELLVGGAITSAPTVEARYMMIKKGISVALSEIASDHESALDCAKMMLGI